MRMASLPEKNRREVDFYYTCVPRLIFKQNRIFRLNFAEGAVKSVELLRGLYAKKLRCTEGERGKKQEKVFDFYGKSERARGGGIG